MTADADLPVWTIKPNWSNGVTERLDWLTDIQSSTLGVEQAVAYRLSPRRTFEALYNPVGSVRSYFDLWLHRMGGYEFMLPLWHDTGRLTAAVSSGATALNFDTTYREFNVGDLAVLVGAKPHIFDKVEITGVTGSGVTVAPGGVTRSWPKGSKINPLRRARFSDNSQLSALTNVVAQATIQFELNQTNDIADEGTWSGLSYLDLPVQTTKPNWRETVDLTFMRNVALLDNDLGLRQLDDEAGRAFTLQMHSFMLIGREQHWAFRQMLYRLRGRQGALWVPTFNEDIRLAVSRLTSDFTLDIDKIGYAYTGGVVKGRNHVLIGGATPAEITALGVVGDADLERLVLGGPLGTALPAGTIGSFMDTCRLASDSISITHHTDTDGAAECKLGFQSFLNERTDDDPIYYPIGTAAMLDSPCIPCHGLTNERLDTFTAEATFPVGMDEFYALEDHNQFIVPVYFYADAGCDVLCYTFTLNSSGPQVSADGNGCLSLATYGIACGSVGNPIVTFDFTCPVNFAGYMLQGHFYFDGAVLGMEITNPDSQPVLFIANPNEGFAFAKPLWGSPALSLSDVPHYPFAQARAERRRNGTEGGWLNGTAASAHDFAVSIVANGVTISNPYQRHYFHHDTYGDGQVAAAYVGVGTTNVAAFADCIKEAEFASPVGGVCGA